MVPNVASRITAAHVFDATRTDDSAGWSSSPYLVPIVLVAATAVLVASVEFGKFLGSRMLTDTVNGQTIQQPSPPAPPPTEAAGLNRQPADLGGEVVASPSASSAARPSASPSPSSGPAQTPAVTVLFRLTPTAEPTATPTAQPSPSPSPSIAVPHATPAPTKRAVPTPTPAPTPTPKPKPTFAPVMQITPPASQNMGGF